MRQKKVISKQNLRSNKHQVYLWMEAFRVIQIEVISKEQFSIYGHFYTKKTEYDEACHGYIFFDRKYESEIYKLLEKFVKRGISKIIKRKMNEFDSDIIPISIKRITGEFEAFLWDIKLKCIPMPAKTGEDEFADLAPEYQLKGISESALQM